MYGVVKMKEMLIRKLVSAFQMIGTTRPMGIMQANVMIGDGADIHAVQAMLGHGDTGASQMYAVYAAATAARSDS